MAGKKDLKSNRRTQKNLAGKPDDYLKAVEAAEAGSHDQALHYIQEYLASSPGDAEALNDAGAILHCLGCSDEAVNHLVKARKLRSDSAEIIWNLCEAYLAIGKAEQAMLLFDDMRQMGILNADVLNRTANVLLDNGNLSDAVKVLRQSLELSPKQDILLPMIEVITRKITETDCPAGELVK